MTLQASCRNDCKLSDPSSASSILVCVVLEEGKVLCLFIIISRPCYQSLDVHTMVIGNIIIAQARHHCTALHCTRLHCTAKSQSSRPESQLSQKYGSRRTCRHYIIFDQSEASIWSCDLSAIIERKMYSCVLMNIHFVLFSFFVCM